MLARATMLAKKSESAMCEVIEFYVPWQIQAKQGDRSRIVKCRDGRQFVKH